VDGAGIRDVRPAVDVPPKPSERRRRRRRVLVVVLVVLLLGVEVVLAAPTLRAASAAVLRAQPWWVAAAVGAEAAAMDLFARLRRRLLAVTGVHVQLRETLAAVYVANALHQTMPGGAAFSTAYTYRWMRDRGAGEVAGAWTLLAGGLVSASALAGLAVVASLLVGAATGAVALAVDVVLVAALVAVARLLRRRPDRALVAGRRLLLRANAVLRRAPDRGEATLERWVGQLRSVRPGGRDWAVTLTYGSGNWAFDAACLAAAAAAVGTRGLTLPVLLIAYSTGMAAAGISVLPGGIGLVDTAMVVAMVAGGIPAADALSAVLLYRLISLVAVVGAGWVVGALAARRSRRPSGPERNASGSAG
jgi:uncharacterized protein (TIRG00374 family)